MRNPASVCAEPSSSASVAVVGAGVSGLAAAYRLRKAGVNVTVFEAGDNVGGKLRTVFEDGLTFDFGPNSMVEKEPEVSLLIDDLRLREEQQFPLMQNKRYILRDGNPVLIPSNPIALIGSKILTTKAKLDLFLEPFTWKRKLVVQEDSSISPNDESVGDFMGRHFGTEMVDYLVDPFIAGTTGSDPVSLSVRQTFPDLWELEESHGSLIMGAIKSGLQKKKIPEQAHHKSLSRSSQPKQGSFSFVGGLQTLAKALAQTIEDGLQLDTKVEALASKQQGNPARNEWTISCSKKGSKKKEIKQHFDAVILTAPLHEIQNMQFTKDGKYFPLDFIPEVIYQPMSVLVTAFRKEDVKKPLQGFGLLVPSKEQANGFQTLGTLFSSSMFPDRAPADQIMFTTFVGGSRNKELAAASFEKLKDVVLKDLQRTLGVAGEPVVTRHYYWEKAFPQYGLDYSSVINALERLETSLLGVYYAGNHRGGLAVGKSLASGYQAAGRVLEMLEASGGRVFTMAAIIEPVVQA